LGAEIPDNMVIDYYTSSTLKATIECENSRKHLYAVNLDDGIYRFARLLSVDRGGNVCFKVAEKEDVTMLYTHVRPIKIRMWTSWSSV
jgi:hypothetical protein